MSVVKALNASTRPAPCCETGWRGSPSVWLLGTSCAVVSKSVLAVRPTRALLPFTPNSRADTPAINGVAIEVPDSTPKLPRGTGSVDRILPPGAATAGLKNMSFVGPYDVNVETRPPDGSLKSKLAPVCGKEIVTGDPAANAFTSYGSSARCQQAHSCRPGRTYKDTILCLYKRGCERAHGNSREPSSVAAK